MVVFKEYRFSNLKEAQKIESNLQKDKRVLDYMVEYFLDMSDMFNNPNWKLKFQKGYFTVLMREV